MSEIHRLVVALMLAGLCACGSTEQANRNPAIRRIILFDDEGKKTVGVMKDSEALRVFLNLIKSPSDETSAQFKAAQVEGRIFELASGTRADVLKDVPVNGVPGLSILRIRLTSGPRITEEALVLSSQTQPDNSP